MHDLVILDESWYLESSEIGDSDQVMVVAHLACLYRSVWFTLVWVHKETIYNTVANRSTE